MYTEQRDHNGDSNTIEFRDKRERKHPGHTIEVGHGKIYRQIDRIQNDKKREKYRYSKKIWKILRYTDGWSFILIICEEWVIIKKKRSTIITMILFFSNAIKNDRQKLSINVYQYMMINIDVNKIDIFKKIHVASNNQIHWREISCSNLHIQIYLI